jgi:hypothetical protein
MVWTEVSTMLSIVAGIILIVAFVAIFLQEARQSNDPVSQRVSSLRLPGNANLSEGERREALRRFHSSQD